MKTKFKQIDIKKAFPYLTAILVIVIANLIYFQPELEGKRLPQGDIVSSKVKTHHIREFRKEIGKSTYWNPAQFCGGPVRLLSLGRSDNQLRYISKYLPLGIKSPSFYDI